MPFTKALFLFLIIAATSFNALAERIYKTVDEKGNVVFTDKKTPDAERIKVQPNVVDVRTPDMPESTAEEKPKRASGKPDEVQQEPVGRGTATAGNLKRKIRNVTNGGENIKRPKKKPVTIQPVPGPGPGPGGGRRVGGGR
jgi:hypothetical protein